MTHKDYELIASTLARVLDSVDDFPTLDKATAKATITEVTLKLGEALLEDNSRFDIARFASRVGVAWSVFGAIDPKTGALIS
jgi:hypothetical protein